jgi:glycosyltransferase involved in cell wall biosynthesis
VSGASLSRGFVSYPAAAMDAVDAVAMPSRWQAYGLIAIEALSAGRILLINNIDGLADHADNGAHAVSFSGISSWSRAIDPWAAATLPRPVESNRRCNGFEQRFAD